MRAAFDKTPAPLAILTNQILIMSARPSRMSSPERLDF